MLSLKMVFSSTIVIVSLFTTQIVQASDIQIKQYSNGGIYEGEFLNGKQHGKGKYTSADGYEYIGQWLEGNIEGSGTARYTDGSVYKGSFKNSKPDGPGKLVFLDGSSYDGQYW